MLLGEMLATMDYNTSIKEAKNAGRIQERFDVLYELVEAGDLSVEKAAKRVNLTPAEFEKRMLLTDHKIPETTNL